MRLFEQAVRYFAAKGNTESVHTYGRKSLQLVTTVRNSLSESHGDYRDWITTAQPALSAYIAALYRLDKSEIGNLLEAFHASEVSHQALRTADFTRPSLEQETIDQLDRYVAAEVRLVDSTAEFSRHQATIGDDDTALDIAKNHLVRAKRDRDIARDLYLSTLAEPSTRQRQSQHPAVSEWKVLPGDAFVRYFVHDSVSFCLVRIGTRIEYFDLPSRAEIRSIVRHAISSIEDRNKPSPERVVHLSNLSKLLPLEYLLAQDDVHRLVIATDDVMHDVPFSAI